VTKRTAVRGRGAAKPREGVNPRQPCPCGSGRRYKACHGAAGGPVETRVARPFAGVAAETELIALREFVPSATVTLPLAEQGEREITLGTVLPMAAAALVRSDGSAFVGLQVPIHSLDVGRDLVRAVGWALTAEPGDVLTALPPEDEQDSAGRLTELLDTEAALTPELHPDFGWWMPADAQPSSEVALSLERANAAILPTDRLRGDQLTAAYWVDAGERAHLRWVRPEPEEQLLAALARLSARGELDLGENSRFAGSFRAHGLLVPVWDLDREMHAREWDGPAAEFAAKLEAAVASLDNEPPTEAERRARDGLRGRQVTLR
jgi:uncharacterized protein DUF5926/SEC-C motif-containing protein